MAEKDGKVCGGAVANRAARVECCALQTYAAMAALSERKVHRNPYRTIAVRRKCRRQDETAREASEGIFLEISSCCSVLPTRSPAELRRLNLPVPTRAARRKCTRQDRTTGEASEGIFLETSSCSSVLSCLPPAGPGSVLSRLSCLGARGVNRCSCFFHGRRGEGVHRNGFAM